MRAKDMGMVPMLLRDRKDEIQRLFWYITIGIVTYIINNLFLMLFRRVFQIKDIIAVALSFLLTSICHFFLHNGITFRKSSESLKKKAAGHAVVTVINYCVGVTITTFILRRVVDNNLLATACSTGATFVLGYILLNRFVYRLQGKRERNT